MSDIIQAPVKKKMSQKYSVTTGNGGECVTKNEWIAFSYSPYGIRGSFDCNLPA